MGLLVSLATLILVVDDISIRYGDTNFGADSEQSINRNLTNLLVSLATSILVVDEISIRDGDTNFGADSEQSINRNLMNLFVSSATINSSRADSVSLSRTLPSFFNSIWNSFKEQKSQ